MPEIPYSYARALEFEGRHPHDVGQWGITSTRLMYLEGLPEDLTDFMIPVNEDGTIQGTPPHFHRRFRSNRFRYYRRIRSADEAAAVLDRRHPNTLTKVCLPLFSSWVEPDDGCIAMPGHGEIPAPETHAVHLKSAARVEGVTVGGVEDAPHFLFENTWGAEWGHDGLGMLPFAYYDAFAFEHWSLHVLDSLGQVQVKREEPDLTAWQGREEFDRRVYAFEVGDPDGDRLGWAFALETGDALEVEELFVAPEARRQGIGGRLADRLRRLAAAKGLPLRLWVPFADAARESPATAPALAKIAARLGVTFHPSPVRWAAYFADTTCTGATTPVEPREFPGRPKSTRGALAAFFATAAFAVGETGSLPPAPGRMPTAAMTQARMTLESPEWQAKNLRRAALIDKKYDVGLDDTEEVEFQDLQALADKLVEAASPPSDPFGPELDAILKAKGLL